MKQKQPYLCGKTQHESKRGRGAGERVGLLERWSSSSSVRRGGDTPPVGHTRHRLKTHMALGVPYYKHLNYIRHALLPKHPRVKSIYHIYNLPNEERNVNAFRLMSFLNVELTIRSKKKERRFSLITG